MFVTNQPYPFNTAHRESRRPRLPKYNRTKPYVESTNDHHP